MRCNGYDVHLVMVTPALAWSVALNWHCNAASRGGDKYSSMLL